MEIIKLIRIELLKLKRTKALWLALLMPIFLSGLSFLRLLVEPRQIAIATGWTLFIGANLTMWLLVMLPLYVSLEIGLLASIEHSSNTWKSLFVLPISRTKVYLVKLIVSLGMVFFSNCVFLLATISSGLLLGFILPNPSLSLNIPDLGIFLEVLYFAFLASFLMICIQFWISIRYNSFVVPIVIGICGIVGNIMAQTYKPFKLIFPWILPHDILNVVAFQSNINVRAGTTSTEQTITSIILTSLITGITILGVALWDGEKRDCL